MNDHKKAVEERFADPVVRGVAEIVSGWSVIKLATVDENDPEWRTHLACAMYVLDYSEPTIRCALYDELIDKAGKLSDPHTGWWIEECKADEFKEGNPA